jgi:hypothetical protein
VTLGYAANVVGLIGIVPILWAARQIVLRQLHARRLLQFGVRRNLDVVVTTSAFARTPGGTSRSYKTNLGEVMGLASLAGALGRYYPRKPLEIHMSERVRHSLDKDLVVLGGPLFNNCAKDFITRFNRLYPTASIELDAQKHSLQVGSRYREEEYDLAVSAGIPAQDLAVILIGRNPFASRQGAGILCAGLSTYGTAAAADYVFTTLVKRREGKETRHLLRNKCGAAIVLAVRIVDQQFTHISVEHMEAFVAQDQLQLHMQHPARQD